MIVLPFIQVKGFRYYRTVLKTAPASLIGYWPMREQTGTVATDYSDQANAGAYTGVTLGQAGIGDGLSCPLFDGSSDFNNIYSAAFNTDFNGQEGSFACWAKTLTWGANRRAVSIAVDASNIFAIRTTTTENQLGFAYTAGGTTDSVNDTSLAGTLNWFHLGMTWSKAADELKAYINGAQAGATQTGLGTWAGALGSTLCCIGAQNTTPIQVWNGNLAHAAVWNTPLTARQVFELYKRGVRG